MAKATAHLLRATILATALTLAGCSGGETNNLTALDNELMENGADPALTSALEDQILVDPELVQQAQPNAARPPEAPGQAQYPPPEGGQLRRAARFEGVPGGACAGTFDYGAQWAQRLPAGIPAYPGGRLVEAAGTRDCRVVTMRTADAPERVLNFYRGAVTRAGYDAEQQRRDGDHILGGVNARTDGAYYLIVTPIEGGSEVALIVNNGR